MKWIGKTLLRWNSGAYAFIVMYGGNINEASQQSYRFFWENLDSETEEVRVRKLTASLWKWVINMVVACFMLVFINQQGYALDMR